jgi:hypothetical protein
MASKVARILLAMLMGIVLGPIVACEKSGPVQQTEVEMEDTADQAPGAVAAPPAEAEDVAE